MARKSIASSRSRVPKEDGEEFGVNKLGGEVKLGDLIWIKNQGLWWPAQVVDANTVNDNIKPANRSVGEVLVRLYGSYTYLYVDPAKYRVEFDKILKQNNGSYSDIFQKSLKQELPHYKPAKSKGHGSKSKGIVATSMKESLKQNQLDENQEAGASKSGYDPLEERPAVSVRKTRTQRAGSADVSPNGNVPENAGRKLQTAMNYSVNNGTSEKKDKLKRKLEATIPEIVKKSNSTKSQMDGVQKELELDISSTKIAENIESRIAGTWELKDNCTIDDKETSKKTTAQDWVQKEVMLVVSSVMDQEKLEPDSPRTEDSKIIPRQSSLYNK